MKIGEMEINIEIPGIKDAMESILAKAEKDYPDDPQMALHQVKKQAVAWIELAEIKTNVKKLDR